MNIERLEILRKFVANLVRNNHIELVREVELNGCDTEEYNKLSENYDILQDLEKLVLKYADKKYLL